MITRVLELLRMLQKLEKNKNMVLEVMTILLMNIKASKEKNLNIRGFESLNTNKN